MKRVCRKVASTMTTTTYTKERELPAARPELELVQRTSCQSRALLRRFGGIENRAGVRADVASIILSSAKGGREGGGEYDFSESREREW